MELEINAIRLRPELSKNSEGRILPFSEPLREVIERRMRKRRLDCPNVFHVNGRKIGSLKKAWNAACKKAGLEGKLFHDLRRTAVRNLVRAGDPEQVAMSLSGHKTRTVFDRYNIVSQSGLERATNQLAEYVANQSSTPKVIPLRKQAAEG